MKRLLMKCLLVGSLIAPALNALAANGEGRIIVLIGPSGVGKSSLISRLRHRYPELGVLISNTTRAPRPGEQDGRDYFFETVESFGQKKSTGAFITVAEVHGNLYGVSKDFIKESLEKGSTIICDLNTEAARQIKELHPNHVRTVFISPPSMDVLEQRLRGRKSDSLEQIRVRLSNAVQEMEHSGDFDEHLRNDDLESTFVAVSAIVDHN